MIQTLKILPKLSLNLLNAHFLYSHPIKTYYPILLPLYIQFIKPLYDSFQQFIGSTGFP